MAAQTQISRWRRDLVDETPGGVSVDASGRHEEGGLVRQVHRLLNEQAATVAVAESLTGGLLGAALTQTPGASAAFRGGVTAYATDLKASLLGVPQTLLAEHGAVHPDVAVAMAAGARRRLAATYGLALTGVAGPDAQDGQPPGTVHIASVAGRGKTEPALAAPGVVAVASPRLAGDRQGVRHLAVIHALELLRRHLRERAALHGREAQR